MVSGLVQHFLNRYVNADPDYIEDLKILAGHRVMIEVQDLSLVFYLRFTRTQVFFHYEKIRAASEVPEKALVLRGRSLDLLAFLLRSAQRSSMLSEGLIRFQGDLLLLEALARLFQQGSFWASLPLPLGLKTLLSKGSHSLFAWQCKNVSSLKKTMMDYVSEERGWLPSYRHFEVLQDALLALQGDVDRLEARIQEAVIL